VTPSCLHPAMSSTSDCPGHVRIKPGRLVPHGNYIIATIAWLDERQRDRERERGGGGSYATWISVSQEVAEGWGIPGEARHQVSASLGPIARRPRQEKKGSSWKEQKRRLPCRAGCACRGPRRGERGRLAKLRVRINRVTLLPPSLPPSLPPAAGL